MTEHLPALNATLNAIAATLLVAGYVHVRKGRIASHKACMISASVCSALFLTSYLIYHALHGSTRYQGDGIGRTLYLVMLFTHVVLAAVNAPMIVATLWFALRGKIDRHRRLARFTLPIWIYVSATGVLVYFVLYVLAPGTR